MTGRYRLESVNKDGVRQILLFNLADAQASAKPEVKQAYGSFINDMYWLAMPWKWMEPGVHLKYMGKRKYGAHSTSCNSRWIVSLTPGTAMRLTYRPHRI